MHAQAGVDSGDVVCSFDLIWVRSTCGGVTVSVQATISKAIDREQKAQKLWQVQVQAATTTTTATKMLFVLLQCKDYVTFAESTPK